MSRRMERRDQGHPHRWTGSALCHPRLLKPFRIVQKLASVLADPSVRIREDPLEEVALPLGFSGGKEGRQRPRVCLEDSSGQHRCSGQPSPPQYPRTFIQQTPTVPSRARGLGRCTAPASWDLEWRGRDSHVLISSGQSYQGRGQGAALGEAWRCWQLKWGRRESQRGKEPRTAATQHHCPQSLQKLC